MTSFRQPPAIEDLGELAWKRIESEVLVSVAGPSHAKQPKASGLRLRRIAIASGIVLASAAAALLVFALRSGESERADKSNPYSRLATTDSESTISVSDARLRAAPNTVLLVAEETNGAVRVLLERGAVDCRVAPRDDRAPFVVVAGEVTVEVVGTEFRVERIGDSASVRVVGGVVRVSSGDTVESLTAGESWPKKSTALEKAPLPKATRPSIDDRTELDTKEEVAKSTNNEVKNRRGSKRVKAAETAKERYARASAVERSDPATALKLYRQIVAERSEWSANALFALGRLHIERGAPASARRSLRSYLTRYPNGANASDARALLKSINRKDDR